MTGILHEIAGKVSEYGFAHLALTFVLLGAAYQCMCALYNLYLHPLRHIPGPPLWIAFPVARTLGMVRGEADFQIRAAHDKYGEVIRIAPNQVSFINPQAWKDIYGHGHAEFPKYFPKGIPHDPHKIISANAADHFRFRRAMLPAFSDKALAQQEPLIKVYVDLLMERLREVAETGESTNIVRWYNFTTFDLIADLAFGTPLQGLAERKSNVWLDNIANLMRFMPVLVMIGMSPIIGLMFKLVAGSKLRNSQANHHAMVAKLTNDRIYHRKQADRGDFMDYIMRSRGQTHELTDPELIANSDLLMVAGSETTATLLSGATYWLLKTPHALKRVTEEVRNAFTSEEEITFHEASARLPYLLACLEEALRIFPPVPLVLSRTVPHGVPLTIAGTAVPEKTIVGVHHLSTYHSELNFHRAREFIPERWLHESTTNPASPFYNDRRDAHRPFSFGPRDCIGRNLAYHEMRLIMARLLWNFDFALDPVSGNWHEQRIFALWEKPPLQVYIKQREI
ncbi:cytochrome P450 [Hypoxylon rubiginosum]|uniref:Cytochrome P450 n=1 Tax=Hypoxylon rubiginosum TaxID=110542 RepID=A0ACC0CL34_9PEZI|nr:cytochrome P450 [Hypoxylon rubiginosum]